MCQLHISLTRAAQIYLELHFCVELRTKKALKSSLSTTTPPTLGQKSWCTLVHKRKSY